MITRKGISFEKIKKFREETEEGETNAQKRVCIKLAGSLVAVS
jgi:hypothetical protein